MRYAIPTAPDPCAHVPLSCRTTGGQCSQRIEIRSLRAYTPASCAPLRTIPTFRWRGKRTMAASSSGNIPMGPIQAARPNTNVATPSRSATPLPAKPPPGGQQTAPTTTMLHDGFSASSTPRQDLQQQVPCHTWSPESYPTIPFQHRKPLLYLGASKSHRHSQLTANSSTASITSTLTGSSIGSKPGTRSFNFDTKPILPSEVMEERYSCSPQR